MPQYPINLPTSDPAKYVTIGIRDITRASVSPYNGRGQFFDWDASSWALTITIPPEGRTLGQKWISFLAKLQGRIGTFQCGFPGLSLPLGVAKETPGVPRVLGGAQEGDRIRIDGLPSNTFGYLAEGDMIQIGTRIYVTTERVDTNGSGEAWLPLWPRVDGEHADDVRVLVANAQGLWRLAADQRSVDIVAYNTYGATIVAEEVR